MPGGTSPTCGRSSPSSSPTRRAQVQGDRRVTWREFDRRADGVAARPARRRAPREQDKVAQYLYNGPEYLESMFAASRPASSRSTRTTATPTTSSSTCGTTPTPSRSCSTARSPSAIERIRDRVPDVRLWLWVDDGAGPCPAWATPYEDGRQRPTRERVVAPWGRERRRPLHALHGRHHRHAEGRDVAPGRPVPQPRRRRSTRAVRDDDADLDAVRDAGHRPRARRRCPPAR